MSDNITKQNGKTIFWNGHLCEGNFMAPQDKNTFLLWTRCGKHDVPANSAWEKRTEDVITCIRCEELGKDFDYE